MIPLLFDQGLPRRAAEHLRATAWDVEHVGDRGLARATDVELLEIAAAEGRVVVTLDSGFVRLAATTGRTQPSVIPIRLEGVGREEAVALLRRAVPSIAEDLRAGCLASVTAAGIRIRPLLVYP